MPTAFPANCWPHNWAHSHTHTHTCKLWRESVILFSCAPQLIYLTVTHSCKHLWELCQTEVNLRLALSALASRAHFFFLHLPLPKSSQLPWLCHVRSVCAGVSVCVHRAHFAALKFYNVARCRKSKRISADIKQLMSVFWIEIDSKTALKWGRVMANEVMKCEVNNLHMQKT